MILEIWGMRSIYMEIRIYCYLEYFSLIVKVILSETLTF